MNGELQLKVRLVYSMVMNYIFQVSLFLGRRPKPRQTGSGHCLRDIESPQGCGPSLFRKREAGMQQTTSLAVLPIIEYHFVTIFSVIITIHHLSARLLLFVSEISCLLYTSPSPRDS